MVLIVSPDKVPRIKELLKQANEAVYELGYIVPNQGSQVIISGMEEAWGK